MKKKFTFLIAAIAAILMMAQPGKVVGQTKTPVTIYSENFGTPSGNTNVSNYTGWSASANMFNLTGNETVSSCYSGNKVGTGEASTTSDYTVASGNGNAFQQGTANTTTTILTVQKINISGKSSLSVNFAIRNGGAATYVKAYYQIDNGSETEITLSNYSNNTGWHYVSGSISGTGTNLKLIFKQTPTKGWTTRIDDILLTGEPITHTLTYSATNGSIGGVVYGTSTTVASGASVAEGGKVTLTAEAADGYEFDSWELSGTGSTLSSTSTNPTDFTMGTANATVTAYFVASGGNPTYALTITPPTGGTITVLDDEANEVSSGDKFEEDTELTLEAAASTGYTFTAWTGTTSAYASTSNANTTFTMPASAATIAATFTANTHTLSLTSSNGTCGTTINGVTWDGSSKIPYDATVVVTATPNTGYQFSSWTCSYNTVTENDNEISFTMPDADVTLTANYTVIPTYTAQFSVNGTIDNANNCTVAQGTAITFPSNPSDISGNKFVGWTTATISGTTNTTPTPLVTSATMGNSNITYYAVFATVSESDVTDELTTSTFGSPSSYTDWSNKQATSEAVYAGNSTTYNKSVIQIRSTNSSGIITTTSGGKATKVTVSWNDNTSNDRTLDIYGKSTAYSATSDLYGNATAQGTSLGSLYYNVEINDVTTTTTELTINGNYQFIGLRSNSGAMYLDEIDIQWEAVTYSNYCTSVYAITAQSNNNSYGTVALNGSIITATPASGYTYASQAYTVSSGSATVVQDGNKFTITPSSDCTVTINFEAIPTHTATFSVNGATTNQTFAEGADIDFPNVADIASMKFVGWTTSAIVGTQTSAPATLISEATMGDADITYYAVFVEELSAYFDAADITNTPLTNTLTWTHTASGMSINLTAGQRYTNGTPNTFSVTKGTSNYLQVSSIANYNLIEVVVTVSEATYKINTVSSGASMSTLSTTQTITFSSNMTSVNCYAQSNNQIRATTISVKARGTYCTTVYCFTSAGNWSESAKWAPSGAPASINFVYINAACTIPNEVIASAQKIILGNSGSITIADGGQLICNNSVVATVHKAINAWNTGNKTGWYLLASPITSATISGESPTISNLITTSGYDLFRYSESDNYWQVYKEPNPVFTSFENGRGYLYRNEDDQDVTFTGSTNTSVIYNLSYAHAAGDLKGFNIIGNPFTHDITWSDITKSNVNTVGYYTLGTDGNWTVHNSSGDLSTNKIAPMQGFLVQANGASPSVTFGTASKNNETKANNDYIKLMVSNSQYNDVTYALFDKGDGINKIDHRNAEIPMLYIPQDGKNYAIATMGDDTQMFNLSFKAMTMGKYTISMNAKGNFRYIHLIDRLTGDDTNLLIEDYSFIGSPQDNAERFIVKLSYDNGSSTDSETFAYQSGNEIIVNGEGTLEVYDVTGRKVMATTINGVETINGLNSGVYIFRVIGETLRTQKIVVR